MKVEIERKDLVALLGAAIDGQNCLHLEVGCEKESLDVIERVADLVGDVQAKDWVSRHRDREIR